MVMRQLIQVFLVGRATSKIINFELTSCSEIIINCLIEFLLTSSLIIVIFGFHLHKHILYAVSKIHTFWEFDRFFTYNNVVIVYCTQYI